MEQNTIHFPPAQRIANFKPYFFTILGQQIAALKAQGMDVIRIDMGSPDLPPESFIIDALVKSAQRSDAHGYMPYAGSQSFRQSVADYYLRRFGVELDSNKEVLTLIGSKEGLFNLSQVMLNPGDVALVSDPGYPVYFSSTEIAGGQVYSMPLLESNQYLPDLDSIPAEVLAKAKLMWLNYPNNPTGAIAPDSFFEKAIDFARKHKILIAHDAPYTEVCFDGYIAPSILKFAGAKEVAIEFNSLSKAYNMAGWRLGMAVGNAEVLKYLGTYKSQVDTSQFQAVMDAGSAALNGDQEWVYERNGIYQQRRDIVVKALRSAGFSVETPKAAIYVWARLPEGEQSEAFCYKLLEETGVSTTPGSVYGKYGEGYLRISLGTHTNRIQEAMERFVQWMAAR